MIDRHDPSVLSGYLDGELTDTERAEVEALLTESSDWREELVAVRSARDAVRGLTALEPRPGFWDDVAAAVRAAPIDTAGNDDPALVPITDPNRRGHTRREARSRRNRVVAWAAGATAAAAALVAVFVIPGRDQVKPNVTAVVTRHGVSSSEVGDPISGLVPLGPLRGPR